MRRNPKPVQNTITSQFREIEKFVKYWCPQCRETIDTASGMDALIKHLSDKHPKSSAAKSKGAKA